MQRGGLVAWDPDCAGEPSTLATRAELWSCIASRQLGDSKRHSHVGPAGRLPPSTGRRGNREAGTSARASARAASPPDARAHLHRLLGLGEVLLVALLEDPLGELRRRRRGRFERRGLGRSKHVLPRATATRATASSTHARPTVLEPRDNEKQRARYPEKAPVGAPATAANTNPSGSSREEGGRATFIAQLEFGSTSYK